MGRRISLAEAYSGTNPNAGGGQRISLADAYAPPPSAPPLSFGDGTAAAWRQPEREYLNAVSPDDPRLSTLEQAAVRGYRNTPSPDVVAAVEPTIRDALGDRPSMTPEELSHQQDVAEFNALPFWRRNVTDRLARGGLLDLAGFVGQSAATRTDLLAYMDEVNRIAETGDMQAVLNFIPENDFLQNTEVSDYARALASGNTEAAEQIRSRVETQFGELTAGANEAADRAAEIMPDPELVRAIQTGDAGAMFSAVLRNPMILFRVGMESLPTGRN